MSGFLQLVALIALIVLVWRTLEGVTSGALNSPFARAVQAQEASSANADETPTAEGGEGAAGDAADGTMPAPAAKEQKRLTASDIMRRRATDVSERDTQDGDLLESEQRVLLRLAERRRKIEALEEELAMREGLINAAEQRIETRIRELKEIEAKIAEKASVDEIDGEKENGLTDLVIMYESMKPKDAARIFNTLDLGVLVPVVEQMKPRTMSAVLAAMDSNAAQRLTLALARNQQVR